MCDSKNLILKCKNLFKNVTTNRRKKFQFSAENLLR